MPLKNIDKANPKLKGWWFEILDQGFIAEKMNTRLAASVRTQLGRYRTLAAQQLPDFYLIIKDIHLTTYPVPGEPHLVFIYGQQAQRIDPAILQRQLQLQQQGLMPPHLQESPYTKPYKLAEQVLNEHRQMQEAYKPEEHHHNPTRLTSTGIPMQMPEVLPQVPDEAELRRLEELENQQRYLEEMRKIGIAPDQPLKRNE